MLSILQIKHLVECYINHKLLCILSQAVCLLAFRVGFQGSLGENQINGEVTSRRRMKMKLYVVVLYAKLL